MSRTTTVAAALLGAVAATAATRAGYLAKLGRRTTVRTIRAGR